MNQEDYSSRHAKSSFAVLDGLDTEDGWEQRIEILKQTLQNIPGPSRKGLRVLAHERQKGTQMKAKGSHSSPFTMQGRGDSSGKKGGRGEAQPNTEGLAQGRREKAQGGHATKGPRGVSSSPSMEKSPSVKGQRSQPLKAV